MFLAVGNDPGNENGASIIQVDQLGNLTFEFELDEQGCYDLLFDGDTLIVPGTDPIESWALGNVYTRDNLGVWAKLRTLPNTIHSFGACTHNGDLYIATGGHIGDQTTFRGYVLKSSDGGQTWVSTLVSDYRIHDIISYNGNLYVTADEFLDKTFYYSTDHGDTWNLLISMVPNHKTRMVKWTGLENERLVVLRDAPGIYTIDQSNNVLLYSEPPNSVLREFNTMSVIEPHLYVLNETHVYRTQNLIEWEHYCELDNPCISLMSWPGFGLIVSEEGPTARLLRIPFV